MKKIGLLSDTHGIIIPEVYTFFEASDEIWHAGDIGNPETLDELRLFKPVRAVWGNIDNHIVRSDVPEFRRFVIEGVDVLMTHIGGYPGHYTQIITRVMKAHPPKLFISGHSHILRVMFDKKYNCLHINPGAAGNHGFHNNITMVRFEIDGAIIKNLEVFDKSRS